MIKKKAPAINHPAAISIFSPPDANEPADMVVTKQNIDGSTLLHSENLQLAVIELNICPQHSKTISKKGVMIIHLPKGLIPLLSSLFLISMIWEKTKINSRSVQQTSWGFYGKIHLSQKDNLIIA